MPLWAAGHEIAACTDGQFVQSDRVQYVLVAAYHQQGGIVEIIRVKGVKGEKE